MRNVLYENSYYLLRETKNPTYLDFYELNDRDVEFPAIVAYAKQTVRYKGKWFFVEYKTEIGCEKRGVSVFLKHLYKKPKKIFEEAVR